MNYTTAGASGFEVIVVPRRLAVAMLLRLSTSQRGAVAVLADDGRWVFFVQPGASLPADITQSQGIAVQDGDEWAEGTLAASGIGSVRWRIHPAAVNQRLTERDAFVRALRTALADGRDGER